MSLVDFVQDWYDTMYSGGYFEMGNPRRQVRDANTRAEMFRYINQNIDRHDIYHSLFVYDELDESTDESMPVKPNYDTMRFDRMCVDIDYENLTDRKCRRVWEFCDTLDELNWQYWLHYSGNRGFHIWFTFPEVDLDNRNYVNYELKRKFQNHLSGVDTVAFNSRAQMIRVPNTKHSETTLYCRPIEKSDLLDGVENIQQKATQPDLSFRAPRYDNKALTQALQKLDQQKGSQSHTDVDTSNVSCSHFQRTLAQGVARGKRDHALCGIVLRMKTLGLDKHTATERALKWNQKNNPPLPKSQVRYKVRYFYNRDYEKVGECWFFKQAHGCNCNSCRWS